MLVPKKVKHRKWQRTDQIKGRATRTTTVAFGQYGLKAQESGRISSRQIESARRAMTRFVQRGGKIWIRIFPDMPMTTHGAEMPMGKGKGAVDHYVAVVRPGVVMFEIDGVTLEVAKQALRLAAYKLPIKTKLVIKE